jgi:hypothetical protein
MYEIDQTYLAYELAYRSERMRGERPDQHHQGHRATARSRRNGRILSRRAA